MFKKCANFDDFESEKFLLKGGIKPPRSFMEFVETIKKYFTDDDYDNKVSELFERNMMCFVHNRVGTKLNIS
jgi:hypothetical protein